MQDIKAYVVKKGADPIFPNHKLKPTREKAFASEWCKGFFV